MALFYITVLCGIAAAIVAHFQPLRGSTILPNVGTDNGLFTGIFVILAFISFILWMIQVGARKPMKDQIADYCEAQNQLHLTKKR